MGMISLIGLCALSSCAQQQEPLNVSLLKLTTEKTNVPMVRGEQQKRFYGAVTRKERLERVGQYYMVTWNLPEEVQTSAAKIVFRYRLASTASKEYTREILIPVGQRKGEVEFKHVGSEYTGYGRVVAWKMDLIVGGAIYASKESYMWE